MKMNRLASALALSLLLILSMVTAMATVKNKNIFDQKSAVVAVNDSINTSVQATDVAAPDISAIAGRAEYMQAEVVNRDTSVIANVAPTNTDKLKHLKIGHTAIEPPNLYSSNVAENLGTQNLRL